MILARRSTSTNHWISSWRRRCWPNAFWRSNMAEIASIPIGPYRIGPEHPPLVIAEAAVNHQGDFETAKRMVYIAHAMGAHIIKFQIHVLDNEMLRETPQSANFAEPLYVTLDKTNLTVDQHRELKRLCESLGILYLCTPFSRVGADILEDLGVAAYKTGSGELTNLPLIEHIGRKGKPMIVSTGMCTIDEVGETVALLRQLKTPFALTHCVSAYPTPYDRVNLGMIARYRDLFHVPVGLSDHSRGIYTGIGAAALGACVIEKHFTLDRQQPGPDHPVSIEPDELSDLVKGVDAVFRARGAEREIFPEEREIVAWARESVVSEVPIARGSVITKDMVWVKRPSPGPGAVAAKDLGKVIGKVAQVDIPKDSQIRWEQLNA
ncbi:MAG: polyhydroxyalkanoate biosynthesis repressor PhaR [Nitrospira sp. NTP2]|nr:polyhydroxyalkanoate biosynthesis repressor PhaR [Nitrospira sp. NTP2]RIK60210.1 MAG: polyhydroxyalkanoate biosynthesis repressor PhaR [Nitrospira sp.]